MVVKSVIAGTVLSLMAGGVVYFGTDIDADSVKDKAIEKTADLKAELSDKIVSDNVMAGGRDHPHTKKDAADTVAKTSADMPSVKTPSGKTIEAKKPIISSSAEVAETKTAEAAPSEQPQKKWLNQYLKSEKSKKSADVEQNPEKGEAEAEAETEGGDVAKDLMDSMGLTKDGGSDSDTGRFNIKDTAALTETDVETAEAKGFKARAMDTENIWVEDQMGIAKPGTREMLQKLLNKNETVTGTTDGQKKIVVKVVNDSDSTTTETVDIGDGKTLKIIRQTVTSDIKGNKDKDMQIRVFTNQDGTGGISASDIRALERDTDISATVKVVMEQAAKIEMPELRDRAYLDLVSYGLENGDYDVAATALKKIEQVELRDTARNRMAVAYAQDGNAEDAFGILDDLEVDALRDVMRLQVIEAMIAPDALPEDMQ